MSDAVGLSATQEGIVSILLLPSSILSILGSSAIIYNVRHDGKKTPYRRILLGLSICDIITSVGWMLQPFLTPTDVEEPWVYAVGNDATCTMIGAFAQFGFSAHWYNGFLSYYFLLTVSFGMREEIFEKRFEYKAHIFIFAWSVATAIYGAAAGIFNPLSVVPGCWVKTCDEDGICNSILPAWIFGGGPSMLMFLSILINNLILYCYVRKTVIRAEKRAIQAQEDLASYHFRFNQEDPSNKGSVSKGTEMSSSFLGTSEKRKRDQVMLQSLENQWRRVKQVGTQSFLYVGAYILVNAWGFTTLSLDAVDYEQTENPSTVFFPLLVLQSLFVPSQGFFNCIIFFRPKLLQTRKKFPGESTSWYVRRIIFGKTVDNSSEETAKQLRGKTIDNSPKENAQQFPDNETSSGNEDSS